MPDSLEKVAEEVRVCPQVSLEPEPNSRRARRRAGEIPG